MESIKVLSITKDRLGCTVLFPNAPTQPVAISLHIEPDSGMEFIKDHNLQVAWLIECNTDAIDGVVVVKKVVKEVKEVKEVEEYRFEVEYEHKGMDRGWAYKTTKVSAYSYQEAVEKVYKSFKKIYDIAAL